MKNNEIREAAKSASVRLWEIADALSINDGNLSRRLRHELPDEEKTRILEIIEQIRETRT